MKLSAYAKKLGISYSTAHRHWKQGLIKGTQLATGTILVDCDLDIGQPVNQQRAVLYARVSSSENKDNLESQLNRLRDYAAAKRYTIVQEVKEIGSGINDKRRKLLSLIKSQGFDIIIVEHKDRFSRFGLAIIEELLKQQNKKVEIINQSNSEKEDILQDLISIITSFSAKIYGLRRTKRETENIIKTLQGHGSKNSQVSNSIDQTGQSGQIS